MKGAVQVSVNPDVLKWARQTSGATYEDVAKRVRVPATAIAKWEMQVTPLSLTQLRELASYFKRPLAAFLLPEPPEEPPVPKDYRALPNGKGAFQRRTWFAIRKARRVQSAAKDLMHSLNRQAEPNISSARLSDNPQEVAHDERKRLGIGIDKQWNWKNQYEALSEWRSAIEQLNILVFQLRMPVEDVRGFSLGDEHPFVIAISSSDAARARIFTLFHEYAHLLLHNAGICAPGLDAQTEKKEARVEKWCNAFSGSFLIPADALPQVPGPSKLKGQVLSTLLQETAGKFKVSEQVVLRRLLDAELVSQTSFNSEMDSLAAKARRTKKGGGPVPPARRCLAENGASFSSLVLEARNRGLLTYADVSDFLDIRLKYLPEIESVLMARAA